MIQIIIEKKKLKRIVFVSIAIKKECMIALYFCNYILLIFCIVLKGNQYNNYFYADKSAGTC